MAYIFRDETLRSGGIAVEFGGLTVMPDNVVANLLAVCTGVDVCDGIEYASLPEGSIRVPDCSKLGRGHNLVHFERKPTQLTCTWTGDILNR